MESRGFCPWNVREHHCSWGPTWREVGFILVDKTNTMLSAVLVTKLKPTGYVLSSKLDWIAFQSCLRKGNQTCTRYLSTLNHHLLPRGKHACPLCGKELRNALHQQRVCSFLKKIHFFNFLPCFLEAFTNNLVLFFKAVLLRRANYFLFEAKKYV